MSTTMQDILRRVGISLIVSIVIALLVSEGSYLFLKDRTNRGPQRIEIIIPNGTALQVAKGQPVPSLPAEMSFVQGDTLVVINQDTTSHQLGPIWVPSEASGTLVLKEATQFSYACSFQPSRYLSLDVRPPVTWKSRLQAIVLIGFPTAALFSIYSFVAFPRKNRSPTQVDAI